MVLFHGRFPFLLSALGAAGALAAAYLAEYGFGLRPCELCLYQRYLFYALFFGSVVFFFMVPSQKPPVGTKKRPFALLTLALLFGANMALAGYQVLVEHKVVAPPRVCRAQKATSIEELRAQLESTPPPACDKVAWSFAGVSMAGYGGLYSLGFLVYLGFCWGAGRVQSTRDSTAPSARQNTFETEEKK